MSTPKTPAQRVRSAEAALAARGGRRMPNGHLQPDAAQALQSLVDGGYASSPVAAISAALLDAERSLRRKSRGRISPAKAVIGSKIRSDDASD